MINPPGRVLWHYLGFAVVHLAALSYRHHMVHFVILHGQSSVLLHGNSDRPELCSYFSHYSFYLTLLTVTQNQELWKWCAISKSPQLKTYPKAMDLDNKKYLTKDT